MAKKTILFEDRYCVDIKDFDSIDEIDRSIEKKVGRELKSRP